MRTLVIQEQWFELKEPGTSVLFVSFDSCDVIGIQTFHTHVHGAGILHFTHHTNVKGKAIFRSAPGDLEVAQDPRLIPFALVSQEILRAGI